MKWTIEINVPEQLEQLLNLISQAAKVYTEGALAFPPAEGSPCANAQCAAVSAPASESKRSKRTKNAAAVVEQPAPEPQTQTQPEPAPLVKTIDLATAKTAIMAIPGGTKRAAEVLKARGKEKIIDLSPSELVELLADLGVAV